MTESTLSLDYDKIAEEVGALLGYTRDSSKWGAIGTKTSKYYEIDRYIQDGLRQFYRAHDWSFLRPTETLIIFPAVPVDSTITCTSAGTTLTASEDVFFSYHVNQYITITGLGDFLITGYSSASVVTLKSDPSATAKTFSISADSFRLPDNFGSLLGKFYFATTESTIECDNTSVQRILRARQYTSSTGKPRMAAVLPYSVDMTDGHRFKVLFEPRPDAVYNMTFKMNALVDKLDSSTNKYPPGGMLHGDAILESCLSVAESRAEDMPGDRHFQLWRQKLADSIRIDGQHAPESLGINQDPSMVPAGVEAIPYGADHYIYYNGVKIE